MKRIAFHLLQCLLLAASAAMPVSSRGQVFIPSLSERQALNNLIPGIVDQAGIMDTTSQAIAELDSAVVGFTIHPSEMGDTLELRGFKHLDSLRLLSLQFATGGSIPAIRYHGFPAGLHTLSISSGSEMNSLWDLNNLPPGLKFLSLTRDVNNTGFTQIGVMPESLVRMTFSGGDFNWEGSPHIQRLDLNWGGPDGLTFPAAVVDTMGLLYDNYSGSLDLSQAEIQHLSILSGAFSTAAHFLAWPMGMSTLSIDGTMWLDIPCFPWFPEGLTDFSFSTNESISELCMPNWPSSLVNCLLNYQQTLPGDVTYCSVLNSTCPGSNPGISGRVFMDADADGQYSPGEPPLPQATVLIQPNGYVVGCEPDGTWEVGVLPGTYSIVPGSTYPYYQSFNPPTHSADLPLMGDVDTLNDFAVTLIPGIHDLQAQLASMPAVPGFNNRLYLSCRNYGTVPMEAQLVLNYDADQSWVGSSIPPDTHVGNTATWNLDTLALGQTVQLSVDLFTDVSTPLGTPINHQLSALPDSSDETPGNNVVLLNDSVVGSFDPNDKLVDPPAMTPDEIQTGDTPIAYTIRFQNTGTYMARRVVIADTLPTGLQPGSIEELASSHTHHWYVDQDVLYVIFQDINLPDSTSDEANSHGFFRFSILPENDLPPGTDIVNVANIVFAFNAPIATPPAIFHVEIVSSVEETPSTSMRSYPNPVQDRLWVMLPHMHGDVSYTVQDFSGRLVLQGSLARDRVLAIHALQPGPYILSVVGRDGVRASRFVKIK